MASVSALAKQLTDFKKHSISKKSALLVGYNGTAALLGHGNHVEFFGQLGIPSARRSDGLVTEKQLSERWANEAELDFVRKATARQTPHDQTIDHLARIIGDGYINLIFACDAHSSLYHRLRLHATSLNNIEVARYKEEVLGPVLDAYTPQPVFFSMDELMLRPVKHQRRKVYGTALSFVQKTLESCHTVMIWGWCDGNTHLSKCIDTDERPGRTWVLDKDSTKCHANDLHSYQEVSLDADESLGPDPHLFEKLSRELGIDADRTGHPSDGYAPSSVMPRRPHPSSRVFIYPHALQAKATICLLRSEEKQKILARLSSNDLKLVVLCVDGALSGAGVPAVIADKLHQQFSRFKFYSRCRPEAALGLIALNSGMTYADELMLTPAFENFSELLDWTEMARALRERLESSELGLMVFVAPRTWFKGARKEFERTSRTLVLSLSAAELLSEAQLTGCLASLLQSLASGDNEQDLCYRQAERLAKEIRTALNGKVDDVAVDLVHLLIEKWYVGELQSDGDDGEANPVDIVIAASDRAIANIVEALNALRARADASDATELSWRKVDQSGLPDRSENQDDLDDFELNVRKSSKGRGG